MDYSMGQTFYHWKIPLGNGKLAYLVLPDRTVTSESWQRMMACLDLFREGLVSDNSGIIQGVSGNSQPTAAE